MESPVLVASRWKIGEFIFVEFLQGVGVFIDVGPFPSDPDDEQIEQAYHYLEKASLSFLSLKELDWILDLDELTRAFPALEPHHLTGSLVHPPAFETADVGAPMRFFSRGSPATGIYFLRIDFEFAGGVSDVPERAKDSLEGKSFVDDEPPLLA